METAQVLAKAIAISEYETSQPIRLTGGDLALAQTIPTDRLQVLPQPNGLFVFRASSFVGTIEFESVKLRITPKVDDLNNVLMMFAATAGVAEWSPRLSDYGGGDLVTGVAELVLRTIDDATRRGLVQGYQTQEERLHTLRGRILMSELAARPWENWPVPCRYDDFTADVAENRVLLAAVLLIRRWVYEPGLRRLTQELRGRFMGVSTPDDPLAEADRIRETPLNEHYGPALTLARLLLGGLGIAHTVGDLSAVSFLVDMNRLFERWVGHELTQRLWPRIIVTEQEILPLSRKPTTRMNPDLIFRVGESRALVGDIKYKLTGSGLARNSDYYQLLAYTIAANVQSGVLIYCQADEAPARTITVEHSGQTLSCFPLSLAGDWQQVSSELDLLVRHIRAMVQSND